MVASLTRCTCCSKELGLFTVSWKKTSRLPNDTYETGAAQNVVASFDTQIVPSLGYKPG